MHKKKINEEKILDELVKDDFNDEHSQSVI